MADASCALHITLTTFALFLVPCAIMRSIATLAFLILPTVCLSWQVGGGAVRRKVATSISKKSSVVENPSRRSIILSSPILAITSLSQIANAAAPNATPNLQFITTPSGLQYADVKTGTSASPTDGQTVSIDYVMSTTGARYGSKIYSTQDAGAPYRWKLGDGSTIPGLEEAVRSMSPGGIRRVIIPSKLAYLSASSSISKL